jgi:hypothetical protein
MKRYSISMTRTIKKKGKDVRRDAKVVSMVGGLMKMVKTWKMFKQTRWNRLDQRLAKVIAKRGKVKKAKSQKEIRAKMDQNFNTMDSQIMATIMIQIEFTKIC